MTAHSLDSLTSELLLPLVVAESRVTVDGLRAVEDLLDLVLLGLVLRSVLAELLRVLPDVHEVLDDVLLVLQRE